jgi:hypothetical protein
MSRLRSTVAGAAAAAAWAAVEPLDKRLFRSDYSDVALLGKGVTRSRAWPAVGLAMHLVNGAIFGLAFEEARQRLDVPQRRLAVGMALAEHVALFPLVALTDRFHPARGEAGVAPAFNPRGFAQATWRHAFFGALLARLA